MSTRVLIGHTPSGIPVYDHLPNEPLLWSLLVTLAQPDEAITETPTVFSLPVAVQEEAPSSLEPTGASTEAGRQPTKIIA